MTPKYKHVFDHNEYPYSQRKDDGTVYEATPAFMQYWLGGEFTPEVARLHAIELAHNVREAYPFLALSTIRVQVPILLSLTVEGNRLSEADAAETARVYADILTPSNRDVRDYSQTLKSFTGQVVRDVSLRVTPATQDSILVSLLNTPTASELEAAREAAIIK